MGISRSDAEKIGAAIAQQLVNVLGSETEAKPTSTYGGKYDGAEKRSLTEIQADFQEEVMPLIRDFLGDLKSSGHLPSGKQLSEAVIIVA